MTSHMRLTRSDFARMQRSASTRHHGRYFSLSVFPRITSHAESRFACVVSKKVSPKAVERNRIKRHCREAVRVFMRNTSMSQAFVFTAKRTACGAPPHEMVDDIAALLKKI